MNYVGDRGGGGDKHVLSFLTKESHSCGRNEESKEQETDKNHDAEVAGEPIFSFNKSGNPEDIIEASLSVSRFLAEICPAVVKSETTAGLSSEGADGLKIILETQTNTIEEFSRLIEK